MGEMKNAYNIVIGKPEGLHFDGKIILEWILEGNMVVKCGIDASGSG
jgi:hypothetical protein